jgi:hypothetical protein
LANDAGQEVIDAFSNREAIEKDLKNVKGEIYYGHIPEANNQLDFEDVDEDDQSAFLPFAEPSITSPTVRDVAVDQGQRVSGDQSLIGQGLIEANDREIVKSVGRAQKDSFSMYYVQDTYDVSDARGVYEQTFVNNADAVRGGSLMLSWERTFYNSWVNLSWGMNAGVGLTQGVGRFVDGTLSEAKFSLWTLPLELSLSVELPVSNWFDLYVEAGPGVVGLMQARSDFEKGAAGKRRRQIGTGYYAEAKFKLSLSNIFSRTGFNYFSEYGITNTTIDFIARMQDYGNFQDDISITGQSLGIGFTFDYL